MTETSTESQLSVLNLLVCDGAHRDSSSGKWSLLGIFTSVNARAFPARHPQLLIYAALRGAGGKVPLTFYVAPADRPEEPLYKIEAELTVNDPTAIADLVAPARDVIFPKAG